MLATLYKRDEGVLMAPRHFACASVGRSWEQSPACCVSLLQRVTFILCCCMIVTDPFDITVIADVPWQWHVYYRDPHEHLCRDYSLDILERAAKSESSDSALPLQSQ